LSNKLFSLKYGKLIHCLINRLITIVLNDSVYTTEVLNRRMKGGDDDNDNDE